MNDDLRELEEHVFMALGAASMCWNPRPSSNIFETQEATEIGNNLVNWIRNRYGIGNENT